MNEALRPLSVTDQMVQDRKRQIPEALKQIKLAEAVAVATGDYKQQQVKAMRGGVFGMVMELRSEGIKTKVTEEQVVFEPMASSNEATDSSMK